MKKGGKLLCFPPFLGFENWLYSAAVFVGLLQCPGLDDLCPGRNISCNPDVAANNGVVTDGDASEDGGSRVYDHVVFHDGVTRQAFDQTFIITFGETLRAKGYTLIYANIVADNGGLADYRSGAMVNEEVFADGRAGVDVDTCVRMGHLSIMRGMMSTSSIYSSWAMRWLVRARIDG